MKKLIASLLIVAMLFSMACYAEDLGNEKEIIIEDADISTDVPEMVIGDCGISIGDVELLAENEMDELVEFSDVVNPTNSSDDFDIQDGVLVKYNGQGGDVIIPDGITTIGDYAFYYCIDLTSVIIPSSIRYISEFAFCECWALKRVSISESVEFIGDSAFYMCYSLLEISLPNALKSLGKNAFWGCKGLKTVVIPANLTSIGEDAFRGCVSLTEIDVVENNPVYTSKEGVLYINESKSLICCPEGKTSVTIPNGVLRIGDSAFCYCQNLTEVVIPNSVTEIGSDAFFDCRNLTNIYIPTNIRIIKDGTFAGCESLTQIIIPHGVTTIGAFAFNWCRGLTTVFIPSSVTSIYAFAFGDIPNLTIYGEKGSFAEQYAKENNIPFKSGSPASEGLYIIQGKKATVYMGNKLTLTTNSNENLRWKSSKKDVATVSSKGVVTPKKAGTTIITVTSEDNQTASIEIKVVDVKSVSIVQGKEAILKVGDTLTLEAKLLPDGVKNKLQWKSNKPKVATVTDKGIVKAEKEGTASITVTTANKKTATIKIKVSKAEPSKISFVNVKQVNINLGETQTLITKIEPKGVTSKLTWSSSNPEIVSVSPKGVVMGLKKGTAKITVSTENNKKATVKVNVSNPCDPTSINITEKTSKPLSMNVGQIIQLHTLIDPVNAETTLTWKSSKSSVVKVYGGGAIEAMKAGKATITVKTHNKKSDKIEIEVFNPSVASGIKLNTGELETIERGELLQLRATLIPETAITDLIWSSSKEDVATVNSNGLVKGLKQGTTVITVKTNNKKSANVRVRVLKSVKEPTEGSENPRFFTEGLLLPSGKIQIGTVPDIQGIISLRNGLISKLRIDIGTNGEVVLSKEELVNDTLVNLVSMKEKLGIDKLPAGKYATGVFVLADGDTDYTKIGEAEIFEIVTEGADDAEDMRVKAAKLFVKDKENSNLFTNVYVSAVLREMDSREMLLIGIVKRSDMQWGRIGSYFNGTHNNEYLVSLYEAEIMDTIRYMNKTEYTDEFKIVDKNKKFWIDEICDASGALTTIAEDEFGVKISGVLEKASKLLKNIKAKLKDKKITNDLAVAIADNLINYEKGLIVLDSIKESSEHSGNKVYLQAYNRVKAKFFDETSGVLIESLEEIQKYLLKGTIKDIEEVFTHATCKVAGAVKSIFEITIDIVSKVSGAEEIAGNYETFLIQAELYMVARDSYNEAFKQVKDGDYSIEAINRLSTTLNVAKAAAIRIHETILKLDKTKNDAKPKIKAYLKDLQQYHTLD